MQICLYDATTCCIPRDMRTCGVRSHCCGAPALFLCTARGEATRCILQPSSIPNSPISISESTNTPRGLLLLLPPAHRRADRLTLLSYFYTAYMYAPTYSNPRDFFSASFRPCHIQSGILTHRLSWMQRVSAMRNAMGGGGPDWG